jgi:hypothetical protein
MEPAKTDVSLGECLGLLPEYLRIVEAKDLNIFKSVGHLTCPEHPNDLGKCGVIICTVHGRFSTPG